MFTNHVFVIDQKGNPLSPCLPEVARKLQEVGKAKRHRLYPFSVRVQKTVEAPQTYLTLKIDPGSKVTGFWALFNRLKETIRIVSTGSGGQTKYNRTRLGLPKEHWLDAACVREVETLTLRTVQPMRVKCNGHGNRQFVTMNAYGFPREGYSPKVIRKDWKAGDIVRYTANGNSLLARIKKAAKTVVAIVQGKEKTVNTKNSKPVHRSDGYRYRFAPINPELHQFIGT